MRIASVLLAGLAAPAMAQLSPPVPPAKVPANCSAPEFHQLDFWVGNWDVFRADRPNTMVARSRIEAVYHGCAIRENWQPFSLNDGGSLSSWDAASGHWRQTWVDSSGSHVAFEGGLDADAMVLTGLWRNYGGKGQDRLVRMRYSRLDGGAVRQLGEISADGGKSWQTGFAFVYKPHQEP